MNESPDPIQRAAAVPPPWGLLGSIAWGAFGICVWFAVQLYGGGGRAGGCVCGAGWC